jgi:hypothetical protein
MVDLDPLYQLFQPKNSLAVYKLLQQLCMGMQETSHLEVFVSILHTMQLLVWKKKAQSANLRNIQQRKHEISYKHHLKASLQLISRYNDQFKGPRLIPPTFVGLQLKLVINFNSLKTHPISKITLSIHKKKEAVDPSAADGRGRKPKILGGGSMATFSVVPYLITVLNFDCVKRPLDMLL